MILSKYKADSVSVYAVRRHFMNCGKAKFYDRKFSRTGEDAREYICYACGHEFLEDEWIALAFVNKGNGNAMLCQACAQKILENEDVWEAKHSTD
jgi:DNA-directed RNA polymerase subunit RPC12/RpoP